MYLAFDKKAFRNTFFINVGVTNVLFDETDDPANRKAVLYIVIQPWRLVAI